MSAHVAGERGGGDGKGAKRVHMFTNFFGSAATRDADALTREGKLDEAAAVLCAHLAEQPADGSARMQLAKVYHGGGRLLGS